MTVGRSNREDLQREIDELGALLEARLSEVEELTGTTGLGLRARLAKLEKQLTAPAPILPSRGARYLSGLKTFLDYTIKVVAASTPVAVLFVGLFISDTVEQALEERKVEIQESRLDLDATRAMEHLLDRLRQASIGVEEAKSTALLVAGYGVHAILPLIMELDLEEAKFPRVEAAKHALQSMALSNVPRGKICANLIELLRFSATGEEFFERNGLRHTVELSAALRCPKTTGALRALPRNDPNLVQVIDAALATLQP